MIAGLPERGGPARSPLVSACHDASGPQALGRDTRDDETGGPIVTGRPLIMEQGRVPCPGGRRDTDRRGRRALDLQQEVRDRSEQGGVLARLGDIYSAIGNKAMAKAVWRRALAILEDLHDLGADEVRSRLGAKPGPRCPACAERVPSLVVPRS